MKQNLQEKLERYKNTISQQTIDSAKITKVGLTSAAALAAIVTVPVELTSQVVCGNLGAPTRTVGPCTGDLSFATGFDCAFFDFDGDGVNEFQIYYYNFNGFGLTGGAYVDPINLDWGRKFKGPYATGYGATFPGNPIEQTAAYLYQYGSADKLYAVKLSNTGGNPANDGYGFITFDVDLYNFSTGTHLPNHPVTGQPICCFNYGGAVMWGAQTGITTLQDPLLEIQTNDIEECPGPVNLPVEFSKFDARVDENAVILDWTTESEVNNAGFAIERSTDGKEYMEVAFIDGRGESRKRVDYNYKDVDVNEGASYYYRLRQIDYDGRYEFSKVVRILTPSTKSQLTFGPNPVQGLLTVELDSKNAGKTSIDFISVSGEVLKSEQFEQQEGKNIYNVDLLSLPSGLIFMKVSDGVDTFYEKLIVE